MKSSTLTEEKVQQLRNFTFEKFNEAVTNKEKWIKLVEKEPIKRKTNICYQNSWQKTSRRNKLSF